MAKKSIMKTAGDTKILIRPLRLGVLNVTLEGTSPLVVHRFSAKAQKMIEDKQGQKAKGPRGKRDPNAEFLEACYVMPGKKAGEKGAKHAIPAVMIKAAMVASCRLIDGMQMTFVRCAVHVLGEEDGLVPLIAGPPAKRKVTLPRLVNVAGWPKMRSDFIRLPTGSADMRYRPQYTDWSVVVKIQFNEEAMAPDQVINLLTYAGFHCGVGEMRPNSKSGPGNSFGMFKVKLK